MIATNLVPIHDLDEKKYYELMQMAMALGSAFQKINFLRDMKSDFDERGRVYFPGVDFKMIISSGTTPYVDFKKHYELALNDGLQGNALKKRLEDAFKKMEEENSILVEAMKRDKAKREGKEYV